VLPGSFREFCREAGSDPFLRCADRALRDLVAVRAAPGARAVVLHRVGPAGSWTSGRRNGVDGGERERERQSNLGQHDHSPRVEARSDFVGRCGDRLCEEVMVERGRRFAGIAVMGAKLRQSMAASTTLES
jgi:hypothetical protein